MDTSNPFVLLVEDETDLLATVEYNLTLAGYRTAGATMGEKALDMALARPPNLVVLDLNLPDISGFDVCRRLRAAPVTRNVPILILSARDEELDRVVAFELGVDDYMSKPFSMRELLLRVQSLLRRSSPIEAEPEQTSRLEIGPVAVDFGRRCGFVAGEEVQLTQLEFELLRTLMSRAGRVQTRSRLLADVWRSSEYTGRTIDTHIKRLRQKLGEAGCLIRTIRGLGYCFEGAQ